jgi:5'-nucleotidase
LFAAAPSVNAQQEELSSPRRRAPLTILQINDVYSTVPVNGVGGLARVATIKKQIAATGRTPLLMLAGDFLSSSVESTVFKGEQMIEALNAAGLDFATLGNHEFDFGVDMLITRMNQSKWQWVVSNVVDRRTGRPVGNAAPYVVRTIGSLKVGVIGLCILSEGISPSAREQLDFINPYDAATRYIPELKREGADVVVALTHLLIGEDRELAARFPDIDVIVGGHEHYPITVTTGKTLISKAGMDARFVARIDVDKAGSAPVDRYFELIPVTSAVAADPDTSKVVDAWQARFEGAANETLASSRVPLDALDRTQRNAETALGDLMADAVRREADADVAFVNSGGIRGNRVYTAGPITQRTLLEMHPFGNVICKIEVSGRLLLEALNNGMSLLPDTANAGRFPQVSGLTMRVRLASPPGDRVRDVMVNGAPLDLNRTYTLALPDFVLEGGDGYGMFKDSRVLIDKQSGTAIVSAVADAIRGKDLAPQTDGRIVVER